MVVTGSEVYSATWKTLYNLVSGGWTLGSIYTSWPEQIQGGPPSFPFAVMDSAEREANMTTFQNGLTTNLVSVPITLYTTSRQQLDVGADQIATRIISNRQVLMGSSLSNVIVSNGGQNTEIIGDRQKVHSKTLIIGLRFVG